MREEEEGLRLYWDRPFGSDWVQVQCKEVGDIGSNDINDN